MAVWLSLSLSQGTPNVTARTTTVTATLKIHYSGGSHNGYSPPGQIVIDGKSFPFTQNFNYAGIGQGAATQGTGAESVTRTATVSYGSSSTRTVSVSASFDSGTDSGTVSASGSINLTPISSGGSSGGGGDGEEGEDSGGSGSGGVVVTPGNVTVIGQALLTINEPYYQTETYTPIWCGYLSSSCAIKITTPGFVGVSQSLDVDLHAINVWTSDDLLMCYALCDSDENHRLYIGAQSVVNDPNQIACGTLSRTEWGPSFSIQTDKLGGNKDYYLFLWLPSDLGLNDGADLGVATAHYVNLNYIAGAGGGDSGEDPDDPDDTEYRYLWIQKVDGTSVYVGVFESTDNYIDVSDTAEERSDDNGLWYVYTFQQGNYFRFNIVALSGYTLGEINITGLSYDEEFNDYTFNSEDDAYVTVKVTGGDSGNTRGVFYIDNVEYECCIDNGTGWDFVGGDPADESGYTEFPGTVTTNADETAVSVNCGFAPDLVVLHLSETYDEYHCSCAASFDVHNGDVNTAFWSENLDGWVDVYIRREENGFAVTSYVHDVVTSLTFDYVAFKYT